MIFPSIWPARYALVLLAGLAMVVGARAQSSLISIETVAVGDPGNLAFSNYQGETHGAVSYEFEIGKYEVTVEQYARFLNAVASVTSEDHIKDLWNTNMAEDATIAGIARSGGGVTLDPYRYSEIGSGSRPVTYVSWFDAARFVNWLHNGATLGAGTENGAYNLSGATNGIVIKNGGAKWWIPSEDEWCKAAYYKGGSTNAGYWTFPTQSDTAPGNTTQGLRNQANYFNGFHSVTQLEALDATRNHLTDVGAFTDSPSTYGTFDQAGNVEEWNDALGFGFDARGCRGGSWGSKFSQFLSQRFMLSPETERNITGFRVATVAKPSPPPVARSAWNEGVQGVFSPDGAAPTPIDVLPGDNSIIGSVGKNVDDHFTFTIPQGRALHSIMLADYNSTDSTAWIGLMAGASWTAGDDSGINAELLLAHGHFGTGEIDGVAGGNVGQPILGISPDSPLGPGTYTVKLQQFGDSAAYRFVFNVAETPLPAPQITSALTAKATVGRAFLYQITASNSPETFDATGLPQGLKINKSTGRIDGKSKQAGDFLITLSANNAGTGTGSALLALSIAKGSQTITFNPKKTQSFKKGRTFTLSATTNSKLRVSFTSNKPKILSIKGNKATILRKGEVTITASQAGNGNYRAAKSVPQTIRIR
jgi:formylglycine-generating enzyme required for sulfatase activity